MATVYLGSTEAEWKQLLDELKAERLATIRGDRFMQLTTGGKQFMRRVRGRTEIEADIGQAVNALCLLNPTQYGSQTGTVNLAFSGWQPH